MSEADTLINQELKQFYVGVKDSMSEWFKEEINHDCCSLKDVVKWEKDETGGKKGENWVTLHNNNMQ